MHVFLARLRLNLCPWVFLGVKRVVDSGSFTGKPRGTFRKCQPCRYVRLAVGLEKRFLRRNQR